MRIFILFIASVLMSCSSEDQQIEIALESGSSAIRVEDTAVVITQTIDELLHSRPGLYGLIGKDTAIAGQGEVHYQDLFLIDPRSRSIENVLSFQESSFANEPLDATGPETYAYFVKDSSVYRKHWKLGAPAEQIAPVPAFLLQSYKETWWDKEKQVLRLSTYLKPFGLEPPADLTLAKQLVQRAGISDGDFNITIWEWAQNKWLAVENILTDDDKCDAEGYGVFSPPVDPGFPSRYQNARGGYAVWANRGLGVDTSELEWLSRKQVYRADDESDYPEYEYNQYDGTVEIAGGINQRVRFGFTVKRNLANEPAYAVDVDSGDTLFKSTGVNRLTFTRFGLPNQDWLLLQSATSTCILDFTSGQQIMELPPGFHSFFVIDPE